MTDYAELWLAAQRAHKDVFEAALRKDYLAAMNGCAQLRTLALQLETWFEDASIAERGGK
jgi:hypothetical protein